MSGKAIYAVVAILTLTAGYVCWSGLPLAWDGAFQLSVTLIREFPFVYLTRFHTLILWQPTVWASHYTANPMILQAIYGFPFIIAPAVSIATSWWVVRKEAPQLIIWAIFGVAAGTLPGQAFVINDSIWQQTLFWPVFLSVFVGLTRRQVAALIVLGIFQFVHQLGVPLFIGAATAAGIASRYNPEHRDRLRHRAVIMGSLAFAAIAKILITNHISWLEDTYAEQEFAWWVARERWHWGVAGYPLAGLVCAWSAAVCIFVQARIPQISHRRILSIGTMVLVCAAGGIWVYWAADGHRWFKALDYRRWILPLSLPFFLLAFLEACLTDREREIAQNAPLDKPAWQALRAPVSLLLAGVFAAVLCTQGYVWSSLLGRLMAQVRSSPDVVSSLDSVEWAKNTPLDHWGTTDSVTLLQGKVPHKLLLTKPSVAGIYKDPPEVPNQGWFWLPKQHPPPPGPGGWFDFRPILKQLARTEPKPRRELNDPPVANSSGD